ncbi:MAG: tRNA lysidine(34) synthetase TilS [Rhodospirillales bacterium]|nr:tRNA lysidine(34) synthetase TilS [Rhodospirillales bacterium]
MIPAAFAGRLERLGPFESKPRLAVAVSGGADSLALCLLADRWARAKGGSVLALIVDHRLRPESTAEARRVGRWLAARGIGHRILVWQGDKPAGGRQEAARQARYRLLFEACRRAGILHLLVGHQREDQAETVVMRKAKGSGPDGLAGMAALIEHDEARLLRPLLDVPKAQLEVFLKALGQAWIADPSNDDPAFERVRVRLGMADRAIDAGALAGQAARHGKARMAIEAKVDRLLAAAVCLHPAGFATLDRARLTKAPAPIGRRALARLLMLVGGKEHPPGLDALERFQRAFAQGANATLHGCRLAGDRLVAEAKTDTQPIKAGQRRMRVGGFVLAIANPHAPGLRLGFLGKEAPGLMGAHPNLKNRGIPAPARPGLPALFDPEGVSEVPLLGYKRNAGPKAIVQIAWRPRRRLTGSGFHLVSGRTGTMSKGMQRKASGQRRIG